MNGWFFLATEVDDICFDYATKNVEQNNLSDLVKGRYVFGPPRLDTVVVTIIDYLWFNVNKCHTLDQ